MNLTAEEKMMYGVMKTVYESGIPISFKGSMVLKACLLEMGYNEETRHTVDIDANWNSDIFPTAEQMEQSLQNAIDQSGINLFVKLYRMYGDKRSAGFELTEKSSGDVLFTMDIDVNRPVVSTKIYEIEGMRFRGVSPVQMIADKLSVISTDKVFRRVKDVVDLYYMSAVFEFDYTGIMQALKNSQRSLETFHAFLYRKEELQYSYEKFRLKGAADKPAFEQVYSDVKAYIKDVIPKELQQ